MLEKIEYTKQGDYLIPNLTMKKEKIPAGKYSMMRYNYLLNHKNHELTILVMNNELNSHLQEIQDQASKRVEILVEEMAKKENITEEETVEFILNLLKKLGKPNFHFYNGNLNDNSPNNFLGWLICNYFDNDNKENKK